jgi:inorganic pyrophosphatase
MATQRCFTALASVFLILGAVAAEAEDAARLGAERNLLSGYPARAEEGHVHVVVEIPAGTNEKWEVTKDGSALAWEIEKGRPRVVQYLPYPANYGMIPGTLLSEEHGGDGDPLDVLLLGPAQPRGTVARGRIIGVLRLLDRGEQDDKLLAIDPDGPLEGVRTLSELRSDFPGATEILETWFAHYKGRGKIETRGYGDRAEALALLEQAEKAFVAPLPAP